MFKAKISIVIFVIIVLIAVFSQLIIENITGELTDRLYAVRASASAGDYTKAGAIHDDLLDYYDSQQIILDIFVKHDVVTTLSISLNSLSSYIEPDNLSDLQAEIDKAKEYAKALDKSFSSIF